LGRSRGGGELPSTSSPRDHEKEKKKGGKRSQKRRKAAHTRNLAKRKKRL